MVLDFISKWDPFRIDALGLVTMIGAEEVDRAVGRLVKNPWAEYLPLLGAFVVAGNRFVQPIPGFVLYNISDGIMATDMSGWLSRWLANQDLKWNTTTFIWGTRQTSRSVWKEQIPSLIIGFVVNSGLVILTVLIHDWFGFANAVSMTVSVYVRWYLIQQNCNFLDKQASNLSVRQNEFVKTFCLLADGRAVTLYAPRGLVTTCFLTTPRPSDHRLYNATRSLGWLAFSCHVICIGQATLFIQILTVVIMIVATILCVLGVGCDELQICQRISVYAVEPRQEGDDRSLAYAQLGLSETEEAAMLEWSLFPQKTNHTWWEKYEELKFKERQAEAGMTHTECSNGHETNS